MENSSNRVKVRRTGSGYSSPSPEPYKVQTIVLYSLWCRAYPPLKGGGEKWSQFSSSEDASPRSRPGLMDRSDEPVMKYFLEII
jgi:hypothetical protein